MDIRLMNDYSVELPLWDREGLLDADSIVLPADLRASLLAWAANFNRSFSWETGWPSSELEAIHRAEGERLAGALRDALPGDDVTFQYWETSHA